MRKPRGVQIRANRLIGPGKCLVGTIDECPPRGEVVQRPTEAAQEPRGSGPLPSTPARARGSSVRATPSLHPPRILKTISLFYRKEDPEKSRLRGRLQLFFYPSCGDFQLSLREFHLSLIMLSPDRVAYYRGADKQLQAVDVVGWEAGQLKPRPPRWVASLR